MYARKFCGEQYDLKCVAGHFDFNARTVTDREIDSGYVQGGIARLGQTLTLATLDIRVKALTPLDTVINVDGVTYRVVGLRAAMAEALGSKIVKKDKQQREIILILE